MCDDVEVIDLDKIEEDYEEEIDDEPEWTSDGINIETGKYDPGHDAFYPDFNALAKAEKMIFGKRSF